jgi:hypothetical protein
MTQDFWRDSGYALLERDARGHLKVTDDFLRAYWRRPEVAPVEESCDAERALHARLLQNPREAVSAERLAALADPDARENYQFVLAFRDRLVENATVEVAYLSCFTKPGAVPVPPLFIDQMAHVILRSALDGCDQPLRLRAGEIFFREQKITINDGHIMAADAEVVEMYAATGGFGSLGQLIAEAQTPLRTIDLDVITEENQDIYWSRESAHDTVLNLNFAGEGLDAFCRVLETWARHFFAVEVSVQPVQEISDERWVWHIGLDAEASKLLNDLYEGEDVGEARLARLLSLFRLEFRNAQEMREDIAGRPVYLALCMNEQSNLRLKPQNLLVHLPLAAKS